MWNMVVVFGHLNIRTLRFWRVYRDEQLGATKLLTCFCNMSNPERLRELGLPN